MTKKIELHNMIKKEAKINKIKKLSNSMYTYKSKKEWEKIYHTGNQIKDIINELQYQLTNEWYNKSKEN